MAPTVSLIPSLFKTAKLALAKATSSLKTGLRPIYPSVARLQPSFIPLTNYSPPNLPPTLSDKRRLFPGDRHHYSTWSAHYSNAYRNPLFSRVSTKPRAGLQKHSNGSLWSSATQGSARHFSQSHVPHAQIVPELLTRPIIHAIFQNSVSLGQQDSRYDAAALADQKSQWSGRALSNTPPPPPPPSVAYVDFRLAPSITSVGYLAGSGAGSLGLDMEPTTLTSENFLDALQGDFSRAEASRKMILDDIRRLAGLGGLPVGMSDSATLRVLFPDRSRGYVENLCDDLDIVHGMAGGPEEDMTTSSSSASSPSSLSSGFEPTLPMQSVHLEYPRAPMQTNVSWEDSLPASPTNEVSSSDIRPTSVDWLNMLSGNGMASDLRPRSSEEESDLSFLSHSELFESEENYFFPVADDMRASASSPSMALSSDSEDALHMLPPSSN